MKFHKLAVFSTDEEARKALTRVNTSEFLTIKPLYDDRFNGFVVRGLKHSDKGFESFILTKDE